MLRIRKGENVFIPIDCHDILSQLNITATDLLNKLSSVYPWDNEELDRYAEYLDWSYISINESIKWSSDLISHFEKRLFFETDNGVFPLVCGLSANKSIPFTVELIQRYKDRWDWVALTDNPSIIWSSELLEIFKNEWIWESIEFAGNVGLSWNKRLPWSIELIEKYKDKWFWGELSSNPALPWSKELLELYKDKWDWSGHYGLWGLSINPSLILRKLLLADYRDCIDWDYFDKPLKFYKNTQKECSNEHFSICDTFSVIDDKEDFLIELNTLSFIEYFSKEQNLDWKIILASNILLFKNMSKQEKCNMLYGYAESLSDTLTFKLGFDKSEKSFYEYVKTIKDVGIIDTRLDDFIAKEFRNPSKVFCNDVQKLDILYIEKNVTTLEPLRFCKNLRFIVFDGYWISKYKFRDFSPIKHIPYVYVWHNSGDSRIEKSFFEYTNIKSFPNIRYSESSKDPWANFCDEVAKFSNE